MNLVDIHTHIVPGVDDGAQDVKTAYAMLDMAYKSGVRYMIMTPHYNEFRGLVTDGREAFDELAAYCKERYPDLKLYYGNEIRYSSNTIDLLRAKKVFPLAGSNYVLTEFSTAVKVSFIRAALDELSMRGYIPVIAHLERYASLYKCSLDQLDEFKEIGALFQVNASSIYSGSFRTKRFVKKLIKYDMLDFVASDCHDQSFRKPDVSEAYRYISSKYDTEYAKQIFFKNPAEIININ